MAAKYYNHEGPSCRPHDLVLPLDEDIYVFGVEERVDRQANDRRLRQALNYLAAEGGSDTPAKYFSRVERINRAILQRFADSGYSFDSGLYNQLRSMVHGAQEGFQHAFQEGYDSLTGSDISYEDMISPEALLREGDAVKAPRANSKASLRELTPYGDRESAARASKKQAEVREIQFLYGGPNNEVEEWYKDFPPELPFGETPYIQKWESLKIKYDLLESGRRKVGDPPHVNNNVPFEDVEASGFIYSDVYDSGSRFKLPRIIEEDHKLFSLLNLDRKMQLKDVVDDFNEGGGSAKERREKDYVPRIFLEKVILHEGHQDSLTRSRAQVEISKPTTKAHRDSKIGTINADVRAQLDKHAQRVSQFNATPASVNPRTIETPVSQKTSRLAEKIESRRTAATMPKPQQRKVASLTGDPVTNDPATRRLARVEVSPSTTKRRPGRPRKSEVPVPPTVQATPRAAGEKRKLGGVDDPNYEPTKKARVTGKTRQDKRPKKVVFADDGSSDEMIITTPIPQARKAKAKTNATGDKKTSKASQARQSSQGKSKARGATQSGETPVRATDAHGTVGRGVTRSGVKFK